MVPVSLTTIQHKSTDELASKVISLIQERNISNIIVGLPLLSSGNEGEQVKYVYDAVREMNLPSNVLIEYIDERHTTPKSNERDPDAYAAIELLSIYFEQRK
jgi:RNase H-fold protein (predicted Holliday junction resolvase)